MAGILFPEVGFWLYLNNNIHDVHYSEPVQVVKRTSNAIELQGNEKRYQIIKGQDTPYDFSYIPRYRTKGASSDQQNQVREACNYALEKYLRGDLFSNRELQDLNVVMRCAVSNGLYQENLFCAYMIRSIQNKRKKLYLFDVGELQLLTSQGMAYSFACGPYVVRSELRGNRNVVFCCKCATDRLRFFLSADDILYGPGVKLQNKIVKALSY